MMHRPASEYVELCGGIVTASVIENASGRHARPEDIGRLKFFVEIVDPTSDRPSSRLCIWDGSAYADAIAMAEKARGMFGIAAPVVDTVAGGANG